MRKLKTRARRYGSIQTASVPIATVTLIAIESGRSGVPAINSMPPTITTSEMVVPRSGWASSRTANSPISRPHGRASSPSVCGGRRRASRLAAQIATASFVSSDGWKTSGPKPIQRRAPFTTCPMASTISSSAMLAPISVGASARSRR